MSYRKLFLDTCVLSEIGRMTKEDRGSFAYDLLVEKKMQLILTPYQILELEEIPDEEAKGYIHDFLDLAYIGMAKNKDDVFDEEIEKYHTSEDVDIVFLPLSFTQKDKNGAPLNFKSFRKVLLSNEAFRKSMQQLDIDNAKAQQSKRQVQTVDTYFKMMVFDRIYHLDKKFLATLGSDMIDYEKIPAFITWAYSYASKIESGGLKKNPREMNDAAMAYVAPYVDYIVAEKRQIARYEEIKQRRLITSLDNKTIKKYSDVVSKENGRVLICL